MKKGQKLGRPQRKHGLTGTPEFESFRAMENRCRNHPNYAGIEIHPAWVKDPRLFVEHVGLKPTPKHEIDRIDGTRGYVPGNVRWATRAEQLRNTSGNVWIEAHGRRMILSDWARKLGTDPGTIRHRLKTGWSPEDAVTVPPGKGKPAGRKRMKIEVGGVRYSSLKELAVKVGIKYHTLYARLKRGMSPEAAVAAG